MILIGNQDLTHWHPPLLKGVTLITFSWFIKIYSMTLFSLGLVWLSSRIASCKNVPADCEIGQASFKIDQDGCWDFPSRLQDWPSQMQDWCTVGCRIGPASWRAHLTVRLAQLAIWLAQATLGLGLGSAQPPRGSPAICKSIRSLLVDGRAGYMLGLAGYMVVARVIGVWAPVQIIGFWGFLDLVWT